MKKGVIALGLFFVLILPSMSAADTCSLDATLINQDPYPANPGEYVELVFQLEGVESAQCGTITFELLEKYPLDVEGETQKSIIGGTYIYSYKKSWMIPYRILVDENAINGDEEVEVRYSSSQNNATFFSEKFNVDIEDPIADFEIYFKEYIPDEKELTVEILNIEDTDVEALTIEIPKQENIEIKGSNRIVAGDLDSNEYTTVTFEGTPKDGKIEMNIYYTDVTGVRRGVDKSIDFDSSYFTGRDDGSSISFSTILWIILVAFLIVWWIVKRVKKKNHKKMHRKGMAKF